MQEKGVTKVINAVTELLPHYDAFIIDLWGVIHDGFHAYPGVVDCLNALISVNKSIVFLSNAPRPGHTLIQKLLDYGIQVSKTDIVTSGDVVREQFQKFNDHVFKSLGRRCFHLGAVRNKDILAGLQVEISDSLKQADFILMTAYLDPGEDMHQFDSLFQEAMERDIPVICANPDTIIMNGDKLRYCAGFFAEQYEKMGGRVHYYGKPHPAVYLSIFEKLKETGIRDKKRILAIGDTLETDILGANNMGLDSALTLTGNTAVYLDKQLEDKQLSASLSTSSPASSNELELSNLKLELLQQRFIKEKNTPNWILPIFNL